jgi:hypothetical protein
MQIQNNVAGPAMAAQAKQLQAAGEKLKKDGEELQKTGAMPKALTPKVAAESAGKNLNVHA